MLSLDDNRWEELTSFFGESSEIPEALETWLTNVGTEEEEEVYYEYLFELYLHQLTITNAAFAIVPWLLHVCAKGETRHRLTYITHIAVVEANRLEGGVYYNREGTIEVPEWLMSDYHEAVRKARDVASDLIKLDPSKAKEAGLLAIQPALEGNAKLAWKQWCPE